MNAVGLITEYNPFHNGHIYHLQKAIDESGADVSVAVMSGNYVQRGTPAIINKYQRAECAVNNGVNLVVELPSYYAVSSAEIFACGGVKTLAVLGVSSICFGCESTDKKIIYDIACILANESDEFKTNVKASINAGLSFPAARAKAVSNALKSSEYSAEYIESFIGSPNNILAIEYTKAIISGHINIKTFPILRQGTQYNETSVNKIKSGELPSASAIRNAMKSENAGIIESSIPKDTYKMLFDASQNSTLTDIDNFTELLNYKLLTIMKFGSFNKKQCCEILCQYEDVTPSIANRIYDIFDGSLSISELTEQIKTRQYTYSRISRCLLHIILDIKSELRDKYLSSNVPYIRILGFDDKGRQYLSSIKKSCPVPIITKPADYKELLSDDRYVSDLYEQVAYSFSTNKNNLIPELRRGIYIKEN